MSNRNDKYNENPTDDDTSFPVIPILLCAIQLAFLLTFMGSQAAAAPQHITQYNADGTIAEQPYPEAPDKISLSDVK